MLDLKGTIVTLSKRSATIGWRGAPKEIFTNYSSQIAGNDTYRDLASWQILYKFKGIFITGWFFKDKLSWMSDLKGTTVTLSKRSATIGWCVAAKEIFYQLFLPDCWKRHLPGLASCI